MGALDDLVAELKETRIVRPVGRVAGIAGGLVRVADLGPETAMGDLVSFGADRRRRGEVVALDAEEATVLADGEPDRLRVGDRVLLDGRALLFPCDDWIGRVIDPFGSPLDGRPLPRGAGPRPIAAAPPPPLDRRGLGPRLATGLNLFNTLLPIARGQRIGLFAGPGVGKSTLLAQLARGLEADVVVIGLAGERGREVREFIGRALGPEGLARAVVVAATSDQSPLARRRCLPAAMTVAEHFRDRGRHVLFLADSVTRHVEAHREIALAAGEPPALGGFPPSFVPAITSLCERAGPGGPGASDITAVFSVLVAGSDLEGPVADTLRGVLDGHVILDRAIAERGRFPAVDVLRSVSRCLPGAATPEENARIAEARAILSAYERAELMVQAGLHAPGADGLVDRAIRLWPRLDRYFAEAEPGPAQASFSALAAILSEGAPDPEPATG